MGGQRAVSCSWGVVGAAGLLVQTPCVNATQPNHRPNPSCSLRSFRRALEGRESKLGRSHPDTLGSVNNLAVLLQARDQNAEAEPLFR